jgi:hypothetical protein
MGSFACVAFALLSSRASGSVIQGDTGSCGSVRISWAEHRQNRARASLGLGIKLG